MGGEGKGDSSGGENGFMVRDSLMENNIYIFLSNFRVNTGSDDGEQKHVDICACCLGDEHVDEVQSISWSVVVSFIKAQSHFIRIVVYFASKLLTGDPSQSKIGEYRNKVAEN